MKLSTTVCLSGLIPLLGASLAAALIAISVTAQAGAADVPAGYAFTVADAVRGKAVYAESCAGCHGARLDGMGAPALAGPAFATRWLRGDRTLDDLDHAIRAMPKQSPGSLPGKDYRALLALTLPRMALHPARSRAQAIRQCGWSRPAKWRSMPLMSR